MKKQNVVTFGWAIKRKIGVILIFSLLSFGLVGTAQSADFSFAIIADPHIDGTISHEERLTDCVEWLNQHYNEENIGLVFVVGDIGWGEDGENIRKAKEILDNLVIPYIPLIGDNEIYTDEENFATTFEPNYNSLAAQLDNFGKAPTRVWNPDSEDNSYFQSFSFNYDAVHFVVADWVSRTPEDGDLNNFTDGTWQWFVDDVVDCPKNKKENIVILSHHPMCRYLGFPQYSFTDEEFDVIADFTSDYADYIYANFAGHFHFNSIANRESQAGYSSYITDATFEDANTIRIVHVDTSGDICLYEHDIHELPT